MKDKHYQLRFLPLFEQDLNEIVDYIALKLQNPIAADQLVDAVEAAILHSLGVHVLFPVCSFRDEPSRFSLRMLHFSEKDGKIQTV